MSDTKLCANAVALFVEHKVTAPELLPRPEFDGLVKQEKFRDGPFRDSFGDNYGDPYVTSPRQAYGVLHDGRGVWTEITR